MISKIMRSISPAELIVQLQDYPADCDLGIEVSMDGAGSLIDYRWLPRNNTLVLVINGPAFGLADNSRDAVDLKSDIESALCKTESASSACDDAEHELRRLLRFVCGR